jgi:hypothetical protein
MPSKNHNSRWGTSGRGDGENPVGGKAQLIEEAKKNPMAVINRLHRHGSDELAEEIFDIVMSKR